MADIIPHPRPRTRTAPAAEAGQRRGDPPATGSGQGTPDLVALVELLFFAYRDFTAEPDEILNGLGFGRAHHRVLHFVARNPGLRVAELLEILRITKQSLARVLKDLVDKGHIRQQSGDRDRRERRLYPTEAGQVLVDRLVGLQCERIANALASAESGAEAVVRRFLLNMVSGPDRERVAARIGGQGPAT